MEFVYKGFDHEGRPVNGETTADSPKQATAFLQEQGISVTELHKSEDNSSLFSRGNINATDIATFCKQLANLTDSDMPLPEALEAVSKEASNNRLKRELDQLSTGVRQGRDLANMLEEKQNRFPPILTALIRAGQKTGKLSETLRLAGTHLWQMSVLRDRVHSIIAYPVMVFILTCLIGSLVFMRVVPHFQEIFQQLDIALPRHTQAVLFIADYYAFFAIAALAFVLLLVVMFRYVHTPPEWVRLRRRLLFKLPLFGGIFKSAFLCRFCRMASLLLESGCSTDETLELLAELEKERLSHAGGKAMAEAVRNGKSISTAMQARLNMFPELLTWIVESCETNGRLPEGFEEAADTYERETERNVELVNNTLPGLCVIILGLFVGFTVSALFAPLIAVMGHLG